MRLLEKPEPGVPPGLQDDLYARLAYLACTGRGTDLDLAVLVRQLLRRRSLEDGNNAWVATAPAVSTRLRAAPRAGLREIDRDAWSAPAWAPDWLDRRATPDAAAAAGESAGLRLERDDLLADPFFKACTTFGTYRTPGQRAACRAVVSVPDGTTVIAMLPTGSGKTEVALCLAERKRHGVTVVVVPTVALAYDLERRLRDNLVARNPRARRDALHFAWTASTSEDTRQTIRRQLRDGKQRFLVTSPESVSRSLRLLLTETARTGRMGALVVDEAHLVTQWGRDFRPEFRTLADFRTELVNAAVDVGYPPLLTLLLSATLGADELTDLHDLFGGPASCTLIAANALRAEPELFTAVAANLDEREDRVLEALAHLPRPAILYVTVPAHAQRWADRLRAAGWGRLAVVSGDTGDSERTAVLDGLRNTNDRPAEIDLVVATSAFGMGIDYPHVRTIVHACLPETVDRWYQELGRGGRDGYSSIALLITVPRADFTIAKSNTTTVLLGAARKRWIDLWGHRKSVGNRVFVDLEGTRGSSQPGSYNVRWNNQLIQGLVELGALRRLPTDLEDIAELTGDKGRGKHLWVGLDLLRGDWETDSFWDEVWAPWARRESGRSQRSLKAMHELAGGDVAACEAIAQAYRPDERTVSQFPGAAEFVEPLVPCGRCPSCRGIGIRPGNDPAPRSPQAWPLPPNATPNLNDLVAAGGRGEGLVILVANDPAEVSSRLAKILLQRGVQHLAGPIGTLDVYPNSLFVDPAPVTPENLTPRSAFVVYPIGTPVPSRWLNKRHRGANRVDAPPAVDVLLLAREMTLGGLDPVRDHRALDALTALQVLGE